MKGRRRNGSGLRSRWLDKRRNPGVKFLYVSRDTGRVRRDNEVGTNNPHIRGCDCVNHRILHPVQGLESGREGGEVRVMTHIRV
jgi:hypothetical protein